MAELKPGKGLHADLTEKNITFLQEALADLINPNLASPVVTYSDTLHDENPKQVVEHLLKRDGWEDGGKDDFGQKVYRSIETSKGELRFTVILTKKGELKLDIRTWYEG